MLHERDVRHLLELEQREAADDGRVHARCERKYLDRQAIHGFGRTYLEKLRMAAQVILEEAPDLSLVSDPLEVELGIFKDRVEFLLLLPEAAPVDLPWRGGGLGKS